MSEKKVIVRKSLAWLLVLTSISVAMAYGASLAAQKGYVEKLRQRLHLRSPRLSAADFPAGVVAPVDDVVMVPNRPIVFGVVPSGVVAPILWAAGDGERENLFRTGYSLDVTVRAFLREEDLRKALIEGAERGGVDVAAMPVSSVAMSASLIRDAAPKIVMLIGRSRGHEVLAAGPGILAPSLLAGRKIAVEVRGGAWFFLLWVMSRSGLSLRDVEIIAVDDAYSAGKALLQPDIDGAAGVLGDVAAAAQEKGGSVLVTTADAPHLLATVLVTRGDFAARFPDAIRRLIRGVLDANEAVQKDVSGPAKYLATVAPQIGDPLEALAAASPATLKENLAFFELREPAAPVTFAELFDSAADLNHKVFDAPAAPNAQDAADLSALKYVMKIRGP